MASSLARVYSELLDLPEEVAAPVKAFFPPPAPKRVKLSKEDAQNLLWEAVDSNDNTLLVEALEQGASYRHKRDKRSVFQETILRGQWLQVRSLLAKGADLNVLMANHSTVASLIVSRDDPREWDTLIELGFRPQDQVERVLLDLGHEDHPRLALKAVQHLGHKVLAEHLKPSTHNETILTHWRKIALLFPDAGPGWTQLLPPEHMNHASAAKSLATTWLWILQRDNISLARQALQWTWWPRPVHNQQPIPMGMVLLNAGATRLFAWFMRHPKLREDMCERGLMGPNKHMLSRVSVKGVQAALDVGVDMTKVVDDTTWAHEVMGAYDLTQAMLNWWLKHQPQALLTVAKEGKTPIDLLRKPEMRARAEEHVMRLTVTTPKASTAPRRARI